MLIGLGVYPEPGATVGGEGAGTVLEVADDVTGFAPGERVLGILPGLASTIAVDHRLLAHIPDHWTFAQAAVIPAVMLTAYHALHDLAHVQEGQRVLIHAATGGVGMAAIALAHHWNLEVFATASPTKWHLLHQLGIPHDHIANSRTLDFENTFHTVTDGQGMHMVLNSLANEFTDASLRLLAPRRKLHRNGPHRPPRPRNPRHPPPRHPLPALHPHRTSTPNTSHTSSPPS